VLVLERLYGAPLRTPQAAIGVLGRDRRALAVALLNAVLNQIMRDGVFHADPHPGSVDRIAGALEQGRLTMNVRLLSDERDRRVVTTMLHQTLLAVFGAAVGLMSVLLLGSHGGPRVTSTVTLDRLLGYNLLVVSLPLMLRVLFVVFRPERPG
jgi:hypothetical protein